MKGGGIPGVKIGVPEGLAVPSAILQEPVKWTIGDEGLTGDFPQALPSLLEARRKLFAIPDCCFRREAMFGRVLIYQITDDAEKFPNSSLWRPEANKEKNLREAPRGVVITAGLKALDYLWANGAVLGSIVNFVRLSPWRMPVGTVKGKQIELHVVRVGDIVAFEDLALDSDREVVLDEQVAVHQLKIDGKVRPRADLGAQDEDDSY